MTFSQQQLTEYAHEYLSGSNLVPIGALDDSFFKSEVKRLWGPAPTQEEIARERERNKKLLAKLIRARGKLLGPRGGKPRSGIALQQYNYLQFDIEQLMRSL